MGMFPQTYESKHEPKKQEIQKTSHAELIDIWMIFHFCNLKLKMFLKPVWEGKMQKLVLFVHCFVLECLAKQPTTVLELGLSVALFKLNMTISQDFFAFYDLI